MTILLATVAVAFAAFCVWLTVRAVNRRERWAKWTLAVALIGVPMLYVASFGPACWISSYTKSGPAVVSQVYQPLMQLWWRGMDAAEEDSLQRYARLYTAPGHWFVGMDSSGTYHWADWSRFIT